MSARPYNVDDGLMPEHVRTNSEVDRLTHRVEQLETIVRKLVRRISYLEGAQNV